MNTLRNSVRLIGNLGKDPELKTFDGDKKLAKFSVATTDVYKDQKGEKKSQTQWHNVVAWGKAADTALKLLKKGSEVAIEGKLVTRTYDDKNGVTHYYTEIHVNELLLVKDKS